MTPLLTAEWEPQFDFRVAVIYDDSIRKDTTGAYCYKYLARLCHATHVLPSQLPGIAKEDFDLFFHVDDGLNYEIPPWLFPRAWWVIDTHLNLEHDIQKAHRYDWVFAAQKEGAAALLDAGVLNVWWLPLAGDPELAHERTGTGIWDWAFVGNTAGAVFEDRRRMLERVGTIGRAFVGQVAPDEMYRLYSDSRAVLNVPLRTDVNMRVFEAMAAGAVLVTRRLPTGGMDDLFVEGEDYLGFDTEEEAAEVLDRVLAMSQDEAAALQRSARHKAMTRDSYFHRMQAMLNTVSHTSGIQSQYFLHARGEISALVPATATRILDVGCATGALGHMLKSRQDCVVHGIEPQAKAAAVASQKLDQVMVGFLEDCIDQLEDGSYDCIVLADILEHTLDPWTNLRRLVAKLSDGPQSCIVLSLPNAAHWTVVLPLLSGQWQYHDSGILDHTHLRFFTPMSVGRLIQGAGLVTRETQGTVVPWPANYPELQDPLLQGWKNSGLAEVYQALCVCVKAPAAAPH